MSVSAIVTRGYGFTIPLVVLAGYQPAAALIVTGRLVYLTVGRENRITSENPENRTVIVAHDRNMMTRPEN